MKAPGERRVVTRSRVFPTMRREVCPTGSYLRQQNAGPFRGCHHWPRIGLVADGDDGVDALLFQHAVEAGHEAASMMDPFRRRHGLRRFDEQIDVASAPAVVNP